MLHLIFRLSLLQYLIAFQTDFVACQSLTGVKKPILKQHFNLASNVKFFPFSFSPTLVLGISDEGGEGQVLSVFFKLSSTSSPLIMLHLALPLSRW